METEEKKNPIKRRKTEKSLSERLFFSNVECHLKGYGKVVKLENARKFCEARKIFQEGELFMGSKDNEKEKKISEDRFLPFVFHGQKLLVPGIPSIDVFYKKGKENEKQFPQFLFEECLIQCKEGNVLGYKSGVRSCLVPHGANWYRLKGCGNNYDVFPLRKVEMLKKNESDDSEINEIRGCMFQHTCFRELFMFYKLNKIFSERGIPISNEPLGFYKYQKDEKDYEKYCAIYETKGERRLNDHVIIGLERLLSSMIKIKNVDDLYAIFCEERKTKVKEGGNEISGTWFASTLMLSGDHKKDLLSDLFKFQGYEVTIPKEFPKGVGKEFSGIWKECCEILEKSKGKLKHVFTYIFWKMGEECGNVLRALHDNDVIWGSYYDQLGLHCNAHPNNLVLLSKMVNGNLLAPLDFDMAIEGKYYTKDLRDSKFVDLLKSERSNFIVSVGGFSNNSGSSPSEEIKDLGVNAFRWGLRDTFVRSFELSYGKKENKTGVKFEENVIFSLMKLALIMTEKSIA